MFSRSFRARLRRIISFIFSLYCLNYLVLIINRPPDHDFIIPGVEDLCSVGRFGDNFTAAAGQHIFFIETTGEHCLTPRRKYVKGQRRSCPITKAVSEMSNVQLLSEDLLDHLRDTPLWRLQENGMLAKSAHPLTHRSDAVRVALLWKRGGLYLDLDCLVFRSLHCLNDTVGLIDFLPNWVENGVMAFSRHHRFIEFLMKYMVFAYKPEEYVSLGPATLTDAIKYFCDRERLPAGERMYCRHNASLILQAPEAFYAINNRRQNAFYHEEADPSDLLEFHHSYLSHVYDAGNGRVVPEHSLYGLLARNYCPTVYQMAFAEDSEIVFGATPITGVALPSSLEGKPKDSFFLGGIDTSSDSEDANETSGPQSNWRISKTARNQFSSKP